MKYWIEFRLRPYIVELPEGLDGEELDKALEREANDIDLDELVTAWDASKAL